MIKKIYNFLLSKKSIFRWKKDAKSIRKIILKGSKKPKRLNLLGRILILAPHSDDEWIGCFPLIEKYDCSICCMDMPGGNDNKTREVRFSEMLNIAELYSRSLLMVGSDKVESLKKIIDEICPAYIALPFFIDWHDEHFMTMNILRGAISNYSGKIICYQVSCPIPMNYVTDFIPMSKTDLKRKWHIFKNNYITQKAFPWKRFMEIEMAEGGYCKSYAANVFFVCDVDDWLKAFDIIPDLNKISKIISMLNQPKRLFLLVNGIKE